MSRERSAWGQVAGNHPSGKQQGPRMDKEKQESLDWRETIYFGMISALEADKASWKRENLLVLNLTYCSLCPHCNKISLADKKYPSCTCHDTFDQSIFKNETPSSLQEGEAGRKIKEYGPPSPSFPLNIPPMQLDALNNQSTKRKRGQLLASLPASP